MKEELLLQHIDAALATAGQIADAGGNVAGLVRDLRTAREKTVSRIHLIKAEAERAAAQAKEAKAEEPKAKKK